MARRIGHDELVDVAEQHGGIGAQQEGEEVLDDALQPHVVKRAVAMDGDHVAPVGDGLHAAIR